MDIRKYVQDPAVAFSSATEIVIAGDLLMRLASSLSKRPTLLRLRDCFGKAMDNKAFTSEAAYRLMSGIATVKSATDVTLSLPHLHLLLALDNWANSRWGNTLSFYRTILQSLQHVPAPAGSSRLPEAGHRCGLQYLHGVGTDMPLRSLITLYERAASHQEARTIVASMLSFLMEEQTLLVPESISATSSSEFRVVPWSCPRNATAVFWDAEFSQGLFSYRARGVSADDPRISELASRVEEKLELIEALYERLWQEMALPNYDVLKLGQDAYTVTGILGDLNGHERYFLREGLTFPEVGIIAKHTWPFGQRYITRRFGKDLFTALKEQGELTGQNLRLDPRVRQGHLLRVADTMVNAIAYHAIVCQPKRSRSGARDRVETPKAERLSQELVHQHVRPYFRSLVPGWKPSLEKQAEAIQRLGRLPAGHTFVSDYERNILPGTPTAQPGSARPSARLDPLKLLEQL